MPGTSIDQWKKYMRKPYIKAALVRLFVEKGNLDADEAFANVVSIEESLKSGSRGSVGWREKFKSVCEIITNKLLESSDENDQSDFNFLWSLQTAIASLDEDSSARQTMSEEVTFSTLVTHYTEGDGKDLTDIAFGHGGNLQNLRERLKLVTIMPSADGFTGPVPGATPATTTSVKFVRGSVISHGIASGSASGSRSASGSTGAGGSRSGGASRSAGASGSRNRSASRSTGLGGRRSRINPAFFAKSVAFHPQILDNQISDLVAIKALLDSEIQASGNLQESEENMGKSPSIIGRNLLNEKYNQAAKASREIERMINTRHLIPQIEPNMHKQEIMSCYIKSKELAIASVTAFKPTKKNSLGNTLGMKPPEATKEEVITIKKRLITTLTDNQMPLYMIRAISNDTNVHRRYYAAPPSAAAAAEAAEVQSPPQPTTHSAAAAEEEQSPPQPTTPSAAAAEEQSPPQSTTPSAAEQQQNQKNDIKAIHEALGIVIALNRVEQHPDINAKVQEDKVQEDFDYLTDAIDEGFFERNLTSDELNATKVEEDYGYFTDTLKDEGEFLKTNWTSDELNAWIQRFYKSAEDTLIMAIGEGATDGQISDIKSQLLDNVIELRISDESVTMLFDNGIIEEQRNHGSTLGM